MSYVIKLDSVEKKMNGKTIVKDLHLQVRKGEIYGLLGTNGSGNTSVVRLILNLWRPTSGNIEIFGEKISSSSLLYRQRIGVVWEIPYFQKQLTGRKKLELYCAYMQSTKSDNIQRALELLEMKAVADIPVKDYSEGMKRRLDIIRAIVTKPERIFLDEPFCQLDIKNRKYLGMLLKLFREWMGASIFIAVSSADELADLADRVGFLEGGTVVRALEAAEYLLWLEEQKKAVW